MSTEKIKLNNQLPYLVANIVEVLDVAPEDEDEEDGAATDLDSQRKGKCVVLKTTTRQTIFLPVVGLVDAEKLKPGDLVGVCAFLDSMHSFWSHAVARSGARESPCWHSSNAYRPCRFQLLSTNDMPCN